MADIYEYDAPTPVAGGARREGWGGVWTVMGQLAGTALASVLILAGLVFLPLPIPLGVPFLTLGGVMLWRSCPPARTHARRWLVAHPGARWRLRSIVRRLRPGAKSIRVSKD